MKVELKDLKVELEVGDGKSVLHINGLRLPVSKEVSFDLIFGSAKPTAAPATPVPAKKRKTGCQSPASRKKLSASLRRYHVNRRRKESAQLNKPSPTLKPLAKTSKSKLNGKSHLNGTSVHHS